MDLTIYLLRVSLITGLDFGMEQWNEKWNGNGECT